MVIDLIKRFFKRIFKSLISIYGPSVLTIIFAVAQQAFFSNTPIWLIPLFLFFTLIIFGRYVKW